ncbi:hypothetical protein ACRQ1B_27285 [Rhizobium panacihumi]|uniref:hypothetical protein n=1 Tax=Rhizobium panacihumi TaxID=2008450 RepID=UPI003D796C02
MRHFAVTTLLAVVVFTLPAIGNAQAQPAATVASTLPSDISAHVQDMYVRVILPTTEAAPLIKRYEEHLNGHVAYDFNWPAENLRVVGLASPFGNLSVEFTDKPEALDQFRKDTRLMYVVDDVPSVLAAAERDGLPVVQKLARTPVAMQGRFELVPGFDVEIISMLPAK